MDFGERNFWRKQGKRNREGERSSKEVKFNLQLEYKPHSGAGLPSGNGLALTPFAPDVHQSMVSRSSKGLASQASLGEITLISSEDGKVQALLVAKGGGNL